jgi:hypothetical protein
MRVPSPAQFSSQASISMHGSSTYPAAFAFLLGPPLRPAYTHPESESESTHVKVETYTVKSKQSRSDIPGTC